MVCTGRKGVPSTFGTGPTPERVGRFTGSGLPTPVTWSRLGGIPEAWANRFVPYFFACSFVVVSQSISLPSP